ncbi:hypothetical protein HaLaN_09130 [Haematococcus lacustris]|uniref:Uncharacterized protein n=1 Tax=Haematococcus lacustris TaxID=44745 RepID=A0A699YTY2_HAELA|nr:hypothetical protein HaLaN_09130 [Haematococcus lacustris]
MGGAMASKALMAPAAAAAIPQAVGQDGLDNLHQTVLNVYTDPAFANSSNGLATHDLIQQLAARGFRFTPAQMHASHACTPTYADQMIVRHFGSERNVSVCEPNFTCFRSLASASQTVPGMKSSWSSGWCCGADREVPVRPAISCSAFPGPQCADVCLLPEALRTQQHFRPDTSQSIRPDS